MKKKQLVIALILVAAFAAFWIWGRDKIHFDFATFRAQLAQANWWLILAGLGCIYLAYAFRAMRWAFLLRHQKKVSPFALLGTQVMGFTAIALIGRVADPVRPVLVARKTGLPLSSQFAVYVVERLFDAGSSVLILSIGLIYLPIAVAPLTGSEHGLIATHPLLLAYLKRLSLLFATILGALFLVAVRFYGEKIAATADKLLSRISANFAHSVAHKIRTFHAGLDIMRSFGDFFWVFTQSVLMWGLITLAYISTMHAFTASPELAHMTFPQSVGLMFASGAASALQLPVIGWFTQIALVAATLGKGFHVATEPATACAATLLLVTFLGIIPVGLLWAQFDKISLRKITAESEHAGAEFDEVADEGEKHSA